MGYQVNPGRTGNRWQQKVNGEMKDFYEVVRPLQPDAPQTQEGSGGIKTNAEKAAAKEPPVVKGARFAGFLFGRRTDDATEYQRNTYDQTIQQQSKTGGLGSVRAVNSDHHCCP